MSLSPLSFTLVKEGDLVQIRRVPPKPWEYRDKIAPRSDSFLIFKGRTKIGMIPRTFLSAHGTACLARSCRVATINADRQEISVELPTSKGA